MTNGGRDVISDPEWPQNDFFWKVDIFSFDLSTNSGTLKINVILTLRAGGDLLTPMTSYKGQFRRKYQIVTLNIILQP